MTRIFTSLEQLEASIGQELGPGEWFTVDQQLVDRFADLTGDHEWIHVDAARARRGPFGGTIAHGYLSLALVPLLGESVYSLSLPGQSLNYGADRLRFPAALPVGSRIRSRIRVLGLAAHLQGWLLTLRHTVEIEDGARPACVVDTVFMLLGSDAALGGSP